MREAELEHRLPVNASVQEKEIFAEVEQQIVEMRVLHEQSNVDLQDDMSIAIAANFHGLPFVVNPEEVDGRQDRAVEALLMDYASGNAPGLDYGD